jgi:hypothetical protein
MCDLSKVRKAYKITTPTQRKPKKDVEGGPEDGGAEMKILERAVLGAMALRGAT